MEPCHLGGTLYLIMLDIIIKSHKHILYFSLKKLGMNRILLNLWGFSSITLRWLKFVC